MSRDNSVNINAGRDVKIDALAVGDGAQASAGGSLQVQQLAEHFAEIRAVFARLESAGLLEGPQAELLRSQAEDAEEAAHEAIKDEKRKERLTERLKHLAVGVHSFCKDQNEVWKAMESVASICAIPLALLGLPR